MALSRLLIPSTKLRLHPKGLPTPKRWISSYSSSDSLNTTKDESIKTRSENVKEPFYLIKAFSKLKEKVFSSPQIGETLTSEAHDIKEDRIRVKASEVMKAGQKLDTTEPDGKSSFQLSESTNYESEIATSSTSDIISYEPYGGSISSIDFSEKEKRVDVMDKYQSEVDPRTVMAPERDQEAASNLLRTLNGSVSGEENVIKDLSITGLSEETLTDGKDCSPNMKSMELASEECYEQKETSSSCYSVQITTSNNQKSLTGDSANNTIDPISCDFRPEWQTSRHQTLNSAPPVEQSNGYQETRVDQGAVGYRDRDQEGKKATKTVNVANLTKGASTEYGGILPNKKFVTDVLPKSDGFKKVSSTNQLFDDDEKVEIKDLIDHINKFYRETSQFNDEKNSNLAKGNTLIKGYHSRNINEAVVPNKTLRPDQVRKNPLTSELFIKHKAKNQVQQDSPMQRRKGRSESEMPLTRVNDNVSFDSGYCSRDDEAFVMKILNHPDQVTKKQSVSELLKPFRDENLVRSEGQMERQKERCAPEMLLTKSDDSVLFDNLNSLHPDGKTNTIGVAAVTAQMLNEHDNVSGSDDAAPDCKISKPSPSISVDCGLKNVPENGSESDDEPSDHKISKPSPSIEVASRVKNVQENVSKFDDAALDSKISRPTPSIPMESGIKNVHGNGSKSDGTTSVCRISKSNPPFPLLSQSESSKKGPNALLLTEKDRRLTDLLVRFVPIVRDETEVRQAFGNCGPIEKVHFITSDKEKLFKNAYIRFKTKEGMRNALSRTDVIIGGYDVLVEALSPSTYMSSRIHPPNLIGIHGVPSLVKNPIRTVMVTGLTHNIGSHQLGYALSFCGARITDFHMGSSSSVAYIELETEDAKEKAIEACSILVSGRKVSIFRIDTPCTTVVRILNARKTQRVTAICREYGNVSKALFRSSGIVDVQYASSEWPSMVNILNSLNGLVVDRQQWSVMPAPLIPVVILHSLWHQPDGRRQVHDVFQNTFHKIEEISLGKVKDSVAQYYKESTEPS